MPSRKMWSGGPDGEVRAASGTTQDITDRKKVEEALRESEERFRTLANTPPALIWYNDAEGRIVYVNQHFLDFTGMTEEEVRGTGWYGLVHPDEAKAYIAGYLAAVHDRRAWHDRTRVRRHDGAWRWLDNYARPLFGPDGMYAGHVGVSVDNTATAEAEEALRRNEVELKRSNDELQQFAYIASHDLREPLRMVSLYLRLIEKKYEGKVLDSNAKEYMHFAVDGADRMEQMIGNILTYSRIDTQGKPFSLVDMDEVLAIALKDLKSSIEESGTSVTHDTLPSVVADQTQMVLLLENLLSNAIKYRGVAAPQVHLSAKGTGPSGNSPSATTASASTRNTWTASSRCSKDCTPRTSTRGRASGWR